MDKLKFTESALRVIISSTFETLKYETMGVLSGEIEQNGSGKVYTINLAYPFQIAERAHSKSAVKEKYLNRVSQFINVIGGFHSHPKGNPFFGSIDRKNMLKYYPTGLEIVVGWDFAKKKSPPTISDNALRGTTQYNNKLFKFALRGYTFPEGPRRMSIEVEPEILYKLFKNSK